ncbi:MAG: universal stress protein [Actinomycetota bacterium]|nr:universal stress protein [Actinomycetota bacterium]
MGAIVVGYDGSDGSRASLDRAIELAQQLGDSVTVVFGAAAPGVIGGEMSSHEAAVQERGEKVMKLATDQASAKKFEVETKMIDELAVDALVAEAEGADARMIVVGNQGGPSPLKGAILGAVPFKLVHLSPVPVLVVPA